MAPDKHHTPPEGTHEEPCEPDQVSDADNDSVSLSHDLTGEPDESGSSSTIQIGAEQSDQIGSDQSGIVSETWSAAEEVGSQPSGAGPELADDEPKPDEGDQPSAGLFELPEGLVPDFEKEFGSIGSADVEAAGGDDGGDIGSEFSEFAEIDNPEMAADLIGETSQDEFPGSWSDEEDAHALAAERDAAYGQQPSILTDRQDAAGIGLRSRHLRRKSPVGSLVGVIIGGLMAVPIVGAILLWGFRRDDFGVARWLPNELAFLLPAELRPPRFPQDVSSPDETPGMSGENLAGLETGAEAMTSPNVQPDGSVGASPETAGGVIDEFGGKERERSPEDALLDTADLALLEMATARAGVMQGNLLELPDDAPEEMQKVARVDWYKSLAAVGEEAARAERIMLDGGRSAEPVAGPVIRLVDGIAKEPVAVEELAGLARQWMLATKRDLQGVVYPGRVLDVRQVGTVWASTLQAVGDGSQALEVTALSRYRPKLPAERQVVAVGVIVAGDVIWAAAWGDLEADSEAFLGDSPPVGE